MQENQVQNQTTKSRRGFAAMSPELNRDEARQAGKKGGLVSGSKRKSYRVDLPLL